MGNRLSLLIRVIAVIAFILGLLGQVNAEGPFHSDLKPYVTFLQRPSTYPTDYLMWLFENNDLVILCERSHSEVSQYEIVMELISSPGFAETVGHIFTEVGTASNRKRLNAYLTDKSLTGMAAEQELLAIYRDLTWFPLWEKTNFYDFLRQIKALNLGLPDEQQVRVYPSDMPFSWEGMTTEGYQEFKKTLGDRDRIMADEIEREFRRIQAEEPRKKALVIMNYRHAFNDVMAQDGQKLANTGRFLCERFPGKVANVLLNSYALRPGTTDQITVSAPIQDGRWDAAFWYMGNIECGFDFAGSPFGRDSFDLFPFFPHQYTYQDIFTGMIFYKPLVVHQQRIGIPDLFDEDFKRVYAQRAALTGKKVSPSDVEEIAARINSIREFPYENMADMDTSIKKWLKAH